MYSITSCGIRTYETRWPAKVVRGEQHADRPACIEHRARGRLELKRRFRPGDIGLISCGAFQRFVADECWAATEFIAGYREVTHWSRVFPSAAI